MSKICEECGKEVGDGTNVDLEAHAVDHWAGLDDALLSKEGRERRKKLLAVSDDAAASAKRK